jgi:hypothetical protein
MPFFVRFVHVVKEGISDNRRGSPRPGRSAELAMADLARAFFHLFSFFAFK